MFHRGPLLTPLWRPADVAYRISPMVLLGSRIFACRADYHIYSTVPSPRSFPSRRLIRSLSRLRLHRTAKQLESRAQIKYTTLHELLTVSIAAARNLPWPILSMSNAMRLATCTRLVLFAKGPGRRCSPTQCHLRVICHLKQYQTILKPFLE